MIDILSITLYKRGVIEMETCLKTIEEIQNMALNIYGKNELDKSIIWMVEELGEVVAAIRKGHSTEIIQGELGDLVVWILKLCNIFDISLNDTINESFKKEVSRQLEIYGKLKYDESSLLCKTIV